MSKLVLSKHLKERINELEEQRNLELSELKKQFHSFSETVKPSNLIKQSFSEVYNSSLDKKSIFAGITSLIFGYFSKKIIVGNTKNPIRKMFGNLLQYSIPLFISKFFKTDENNEKEI